MKLLLSLLLLLLFEACYGSRGATNSNNPTPPTPSAKQLAAIEKIRGELNEAFEAGEVSRGEMRLWFKFNWFNWSTDSLQVAEGEGVIVQPAWTKQGSHRVTASDPAPKVIVNSAALQAAIS